MTIGTAPTTLSTVDELILLAYKRASLVPLELNALTSQQVAHGRVTLDKIIDELSVYGVNSWSHDFYDLSLTVGTEIYTLPTDVLNVVDSGSYIQASDTSTTQTNGETPVNPIAAGQWNSLSSKSAEGNPKLYYAKRSSHQVEVRLWPIPSEAGTIRFRIHRFFGSSLDGSNTPDVNRYWHRYLIIAMACDLCYDSNMPKEKIQALIGERSRVLDWCKMYAMPDQEVQTLFTHVTPWSYC